MSKLKRKGRLTTKNLSKKNLGDIYTLISNRLKKHNIGYGVHITRKDKIGIMQEAEKLVRTKGSKFSREDKADLKSIVDGLKENSKNSTLDKRGTVGRVEKQKNSSLSNKKEKLFSGSNLNFNNSAESLNKRQDIHQLGDNNQVSKPEDYLDIYKPPEQDDEIEELRKQAKDLAI